jgi:hypothetical protein
MKIEVARDADGAQAPFNFGGDLAFGGREFCRGFGHGGVKRVTSDSFWRSKG